MSYAIIGRFGHNAHSHEIREMLGLSPTAKLPVAGMPPRDIQGIAVWVMPLPERNGAFRHKRSTHRVIARCPACGRAMSVGRLHQHKCKETEPQHRDEEDYGAGL